MRMTVENSNPSPIQNYFFWEGRGGNISDSLGKSWSCVASYVWLLHNNVNVLLLSELEQSDANLNAHHHQIVGTLSRGITMHYQRTHWACSFSLHGKTHSIHHLKKINFFRYVLNITIISIAIVNIHIAWWMFFSNMVHLNSKLCVCVCIIWYTKSSD